MTAESHTTTDHDTIRAWAEARSGEPARVKDTAQSPDDAGVLRIAFYPEQESLEPISWDEFFEKFDHEDLAFLYQEHTSDGKLSRFFKLVARE